MCHSYRFTVHRLSIGPRLRTPFIHRLYGHGLCIAKSYAMPELTVIHRVCLPLDRLDHVSLQDHAHRAWISHRNHNLITISDRNRKSFERVHRACKCPE